MPISFKPDLGFATYIPDYQQASKEVIKYDLILYFSTLDPGKYELEFDEYYMEVNTMFFQQNHWQRVAQSI